VRNLDDDLENRGYNGGLLELDCPKDLDAVGEQLVDVVHELVAKRVDLGVASRGTVTTSPGAA